MKIATGDIETADLEAIQKFSLARVIPTWNQNARDEHDFITAVAHAAIITLQKRAAGEQGEMVMDLSILGAPARAYLAELAGKWRAEAIAAENYPAAEFFARIGNLLASEEESRRELERIFSL